MYDNDYSLIIDIYFYGTFSTESQNLLVLALNSLDTLSDVRKKRIYAYLLIKTLSIPNPSLACMLLILLL
jgi:hypothetical protein